MNNPHAPAPFSEAVLAGHPDRWCDRLADHLVDQTTRSNERNYAQIEISAWHRRVFVTGELRTSLSPESAHRRILETTRNFIAKSHPDDDPEDWHIHDHVSVSPAPEPGFLFRCNDQAIVTGYAWSGPGCANLPPAHFLARFLAGEIDAARLPGGPLEGLGPDGKLLVHLQPDQPDLRYVPAGAVVTIQHPRSMGLLEVSVLVREFIVERLSWLSETTGIWEFDPKNFTLAVNPNGEFHLGGLLADNGQTGRKLAFDFYGPSVPVGGGALHGKSISHTDRAGALLARRAALSLTAPAGIPELFVAAAYQPGAYAPNWIHFRIRTQKDGWITDEPPSAFYQILRISRGFSPAFPNRPGLLPYLANQGHFTNPDFPWNQRNPEM